MQYKSAVACLTWLLVVAVTGESVAKFDNYRVFRMTVNDELQLNGLRHLEQSLGWDFWRSAELVGQTAELMVAPQNAAKFAEIARELRLQPILLVNDVQSLIDNETPTTRASTFGWTDYHNLDAIYAWLDEQIATYPALLTNHIVGESFEKRPIRAVRLSHKAGNPTIFIEANIHAREWITSATATWLLNELLTSNDTAVLDLAQNFDWMIVPVFNVDGFAYSHRVNRMWRKTRQPHGTICYGADPNRNFNASWMEIGASQNICSETYAGPAPWSEPETKALANFLSGISGSVKAYIAFHSYGQYFMFPYGHTALPAPNFDALLAVAQKFKDAAAVRYNTTYRIGPSSTAIYPTSGSSVDWVYVDQGVKLAYTAEFRDLGAFGFLLPASQIVPNCLEFLDGLLAFVKEGRVQNHL